MHGYGGFGGNNMMPILIMLMCSNGGNMGFGGDNMMLILMLLLCGGGGGGMGFGACDVK